MAPSRFGDTPVFSASSARSSRGGPAFHLAQGEEPFPGYMLQRILGRGGWGEVWKAVRQDGREFALKFLPSDSNFMAAKEIRALQAVRQLKHPHLLAIDQVWCCAGHLVVAMAVAEGSLLDLLETYVEESKTPIFPEHVCFYLTQAAQVLDFLNTRQHLIDGNRVAFRHCDVKPSNLLLFGNTVKLADFSLVVQTTSPRCSHRRIGTPLFTAPEVYQGQLTDQSDQYSLAVTYCQLRGGRFPIPVQSFDRPANEPWPVPELDMLTRMERPIIARALAPIPQDRWPSCGLMMRHLSSVFQDAMALTP